MSTLTVSRSQTSGLEERHVLGMAEMGYRGLSEQWLKRRAGDLHWQLIARAAGQREAVFTCSDGEPLYAAFCATSVKLARPELPRLGGELTLSADLYRVGHGRLSSLLTISADGVEVGRMVLVSMFVGRTAPGVNRSVVRRSPRALAMPPEAPLAIRRVAEHSSVVAREIRNQVFMRASLPERQRVLPCPATDFNAAGLLYFPSYSALADRALFQAGEKHIGMLASRHVIYLGNVEPGEWTDISFRRRPLGYDVALFGSGERPLALMRVRFRHNR